MLARILVVAVAGLMALTLACSGGGSKPSVATSATQPTVPATSRPVSTPSGVPAATTGLSDLSLVFIDTRQPSSIELFVAAGDGSAPKSLAKLATGSRILDLRAKLLAISAPTQLTFMDLTNGQTRSAPIVAPSEGRFVDDKTFVYTKRNGCGSPDPSKVTLFKLDLTSLASTEVGTIAIDGGNIVGVDARSGTVALAPRGCDVAQKEVRVYKLADSSLVRTVPTKGCGFSAASLEGGFTLVSWVACNAPTTTSSGNPNGDATIYDISGGSTEARDVKPPAAAGNVNNQPFKARPGKAQAALGTTVTAPGTGPGRTMGTGVWLLDLKTGNFENVRAANGSEQYPIAWSTDGRYLLTASVQAQGVCAFDAIDVEAKQVKAIDPAITMCGVNGQVIGWTSLK